MANDCSERVCQFGLAHVDTPKGDLNMDGDIDNANKLVAVNNFVYPYGTTEQFPAMQDSDLQYVPQSAHYYMECSNKGVCDRATGNCQCYDGYDGAACQRASCPGFPDNTCSGHGVCRTIEQLADDEYGNVYKLWDRKTTMGCSCDAGYYGPDCSLRQCKNGVDPLYLDDTATLRYSTFDVAVLTTSPSIDFSDGTPLQGQAYWSIRFFDIFGEDWLTEPIKAGASCEDVQAALYSLPNNAIPDGSIWCTMTTNAGVDGIDGWTNGVDYHYATGSDDPGNYINGPIIDYKNGRIIKYPLAFWSERIRGAYNPVDSGVGGTTYDLSGYIYRLKFLGNPGKLRQPEVEIYLDGKRPSIVSHSGEVITAVWTDGQLGENKDFFADHCDGVSPRLAYKAQSASQAKPVFYLTGFSAATKAILKTCLGSSDFDNDNNVEVYNWDYGSKSFPHIVKLVKSHTTYTDGGYYVALYYYYDPTDASITYDNSGIGGTFVMLNPFFSPDDYGFGYKFQNSHSNADIGGDYIGTDPFEVYTTKGTLALTSNYSQASFGFGSQQIYMSNYSYDVMAGGNLKYDGDISCEVGANNGFVKHGYVQYCLNRTDYFTVLNFEDAVYNPQHLNLYQAMKLSMNKYYSSVGQVPAAYGQAVDGYPKYDQNGGSINQGFVSGPNKAVTYKQQRNPILKDFTAGSYDSHFMIHTITTDISTNWATTIPANPVVFHVYKFFPSADSTYEYVAPCSNRGLCDSATGLCTCFPGYANDDCSEQNSLHV